MPGHWIAGVMAGWTKCAIDFVSARYPADTSVLVSPTLPSLSSADSKCRWRRQTTYRSYSNHPSTSCGIRSESKVSRGCGEASVRALSTGAGWERCLVVGLIQCAEHSARR